MNIRWVCLLASVSAFAVPVAAYAQQVEEIVVTAQKREERLQDVPVAVTPLTSAILEKSGVTSTAGLSNVTPGLIMTRNVTVAQPTIRGIGGRNTGASDEGTVPIYIDGVYQSMQQTGFFDFNNIDRIEVLKGPQGTLFGRNAMGGAINITTTQPSHEASAKFGASYSRFGAKALDLYGNTPLGENLAANIAIRASGDDGYVTNLTTGKKDRGVSEFFGVRAKALWTPRDNVKVTFGASNTVSSDDSAVAAFPLNGNSLARRTNPTVLLAGPFQTSTDFRPGLKVKQTEGFVNAKVGFQPFDVSFLASYEDSYALTQTDYDATLVPVGHFILPLGSKAYTSELRATSNGDGRLKWIGGVFYYSQKGFQGTNQLYSETQGALAGPIVDSVVNTTANSIALFGEATFEVTKQLSLTAGIRYTKEDRDLNQRRSSNALNAPIAVPTQWAAASTSFEKTSPRFTVQYAFTDKVRTYLTYSQGFKSGVYNGTTFISLGVAPGAVRPEVLNAVEAGIKTEPMRSLRFNVALFNYDYQNMQVQTRDPITGSTVLLNAAGAKNYGGEAELTWAVTKVWNISAGASMQHARFDSFPQAQIYVALPGGVGNSSTFGSVKGKAIPRSPDTTANVSTDYTVPVFGGELLMAANLAWTSNYYWDLASNYDNLGSHSDLSARAAWSSPDKVHRLTLFGNNLTNSKTPILINPSAGGTYASFVKPWVVGVKYEYFWH